METVTKFTLLGSKITADGDCSHAIKRCLLLERPWKRKWQPSPVFLPEKPHGQRSLAGYSPWGRNVRHDLVTEQQKSF